ncbi:MAG: YceI family protein [Chitinophagaceae bacterium]|nr:YceI family protein [Chitinophagaceae bacterium]MBL0055528.1 YceI family protein [Chitinophagaceae bacterium]
MKNLILSLALLVAFTQTTQSQNFFTKNGKISFFSKTSMENIDAVNNQVVSVVNNQTGDMAFSVLINGFLFKKALMQEHFNENYMESAKFPKASFKGKIADLAKIDLAKDGNYPVSVTGDLTMHGVTKNLTVPGNIIVKSGKFSAMATFNLLLADYNISIPKVVENNIAKSIEIKVDCNYEPK